MFPAILSLIITVLAAIYFVSDCRGKLNGAYEGTGVVYLMFPVFHAAICGLSSALILGVNTNFGFIDLIDDFSEKKLLSIILCFLFAVPEPIISVIGAGRFIRRNFRSGLSDCNYKLCMISAAVSIPAAVAAMGMAVNILIKMEIFSSIGIILLLFLGLLFLWVGFIFILPLIIVYYGLTVVIALNIPAILGITFCILHLIAAYGGISSAAALYRSGKISQKRAVLYSILSMLMFTNLYALSQMKSK